jgi:hypothetical protein
MDDDLRRRGGRPTKPAEPSEKKIKLSLTVPAETKVALDAARESGRTQAEEAVRLIHLGRLFESFGRFTLPPEQQQRAVELLTIFSGGASPLVGYFIEHDGPDEKERWLRWQSIHSAVLSYRANNPLRWSPEDEAKAEDRPEGHDEAAD